jgi:hypothetical protein
MNRRGLDAGRRAAGFIAGAPHLHVRVDGSASPQLRFIARGARAVEVASVDDKGVPRLWRAPLARWSL